MLFSFGAFFYRTPALRGQIPGSLWSEPVRSAVALPALVAVPGRATVPLALPFPARRCYRVSQGNNGGHSHHNRSNRYAWDFSMPVGTPVAAAAAGQVVAPPGGGKQSIVLDHGGGVYTLYAHLSRLRVRPGQRVRSGEIIALSGREAGLLPHLHFSAVALYPQLTSLPARLADVGRDGGIPRVGRTYCAGKKPGQALARPTTLRADTFRAQGIRLSAATPAHILVIGRTYRLTGRASRAFAPITYQVRSRRGALLASHSTFSGAKGDFVLNVRIGRGKPGEAVTQLLYSDPRRMGSAVSAVLAPG